MPINYPMIRNKLKKFRRIQNRLAQLSSMHIAGDCPSSQASQLEYSAIHFRCLVSVKLSIKFY